MKLKNKERFDLQKTQKINLPVKINFDQDSDCLLFTSTLN